MDMKYTLTITTDQGDIEFSYGDELIERVRSYYKIPLNHVLDERYIKTYLIDEMSKKVQEEVVNDNQASSIDV
jgi:hypothetical protein